MLKFCKGHVVPQLRSFDLLDDGDLRAYNRLCRNRDIKVISEIDREIKGFPGNEIESGEPSKLIRLVKYLIPEDQLEKKKGAKNE
jgi:hypothetical protein